MDTVVRLMHDLFITDEPDNSVSTFNLETIVEFSVYVSEKYL